MCTQTTYYSEKEGSNYIPPANGEAENLSVTLMVSVLYALVYNAVNVKRIIVIFLTEPPTLHNHMHKCVDD